SPRAQPLVGDLLLVKGGLEALSGDVAGQVLSGAGRQLAQKRILRVGETRHIGDSKAPVGRDRKWLRHCSSPLLMLLRAATDLVFSPDWPSGFDSDSPFSGRNGFGGRGHTFSPSRTG